MGAESGSKQDSLLLNLPLELREHIYVFYFQHACQAEERKQPHEPALTRISKQIRNESLSIYYSIYTLPVQSYIRCSYHGQIWLRTEPWYHDIPPLKIRYIQHFHLNIALIDRYTGQRVPIEFTVDLPRTRHAAIIQHSFARSWYRNPHRIGDPADFEDLISVLRDHLVAALDNLMKNPGIGNITAKDIDRLVKIDPDSLPL